MSVWRDEKYLRLVSPQLDRFTQKHQHTFNFRCPLCGDSERVKTKARGYVYPKQQILMYKCHNCSVALPFSALLKRLSRPLYDEYLMEEYREDHPTQETTPESSPEPLADTPAHALSVPELPSLADCRDPQHALYDVYSYAVNRQLPESAMSRLFATNRAHTWLTPLVGEDKAEKVADTLPYLVQPLILPSGEWYGAQLRLIARKEFLTFRWSHDPLKMFGLDAVRNDEAIWVLEGPIDSLFIPNAVAACGSAMLEAVRIAADHGLESNMCIYVWDNEPRNKEVCHQIQTAIRLREQVVIWPRSFPKDINDAVRSGHDAQSILSLMKRRTFFGLQAELEFSQWKH